MDKEEQKIISEFVSSTIACITLIMGYDYIYVLLLHSKKTSLVRYRCCYPTVVRESRSIFSFPTLPCVCVCVCPPITICHLSKRRRQTPRSEAELAPHRFSTCFSPAGRKWVTRRQLNLKRTTTRRSVPCARTWSKIQPCLSRPGGASSLFDRAL